MEADCSLVPLNISTWLSCRVLHCPERCQCLPPSPKICSISCALAQMNGHHRSTWSSELGAIETLFLTPLYQLCPPSGWQLSLGSDAFSSHNHSHNPTFCLSHALLQWHPRDLSFCHSFPYSNVSLHCCQRFFPINQPWPGIPYRLGPKLLTLTFKTLDSQTPDCPCRLTSCCSFIEPHPPQTQGPVPAWEQRRKLTQSRKVYTNHHKWVGPYRALRTLSLAGKVLCHLCLA